MLRPNPYKELPREDLPGGMARQVLDDLQREDPVDEETEED